MKAVGIRVHTVRYQKARKRIGSGTEGNNDDSWKNSKEFKRIRSENCFGDYFIMPVFIAPPSFL
jgi:hypothetical protein